MSGLTRYELGILGGGKIGLVSLEKPIGKGWTPYDEACAALAAKDRELAALRESLDQALKDCVDLKHLKDKFGAMLEASNTARSAERAELSALRALLNRCRLHMDRSTAASTQTAAGEMWEHEQAELMEQIIPDALAGYDLQDTELAEAVRLLERARPYIPTVEARHLFADLNAFLSAHPAPPTIASDGSKA
jgi:hypothetical protein